MITPALAQEQESIGDAPTNHTETYQQIGPTPDESERFFWEYHQGKPESYRAICEKPLNRGDADLCQQWRMAEAAEKQADLTHLLLIATIFEIAALVAVLGFTIYSVSLTRKATKAAVDANQIARDTAKQELRAYITILNISMIWPDNGPEARITVRFQNSGQTPASEMKIWGFASATKDTPDFAPLEREEYERLARFNLGAGDNIPHDIGVVFAPNTSGADVLNQQANIFSWGQVEYLDIFQETRTTDFRFQLVGIDHARSLYHFGPTKDGNKIT